MWREQLVAVEERLRAVDWPREVAAARARAVRWRPVSSLDGRSDPLPFVARSAPARSGGQRVGLDADDRPVIVLIHPGGERERAASVWHHRDDGFDELAREGTILRHAIAVDGRVRWVVEAGALGSVAIRHLTWSGDEAVRCTEARSWTGHRAASLLTTLTLDHDGRHERLRRAVARDDGAPAGDLVADLARALEHAATLVTDEVIWDGRVQRPEPWPDDPEALVEPLAQALDRALRQAARRSGVVEPFCLTVRPGPLLEGPVLPPHARVAGMAFRERMRAASVHDGAAVLQLHLGDTPDGVADLDLVDDLDAEALRACRAVSTAVANRDWASGDDPVDAILAVLARRLAELLNQRPFTGATTPFAALVQIDDLHAAELDPLRRYAEVVGAAAATAFTASLGSTAPALDQAGADALAERALTDRDALEELLALRGLGEHAHRLAHEVAAPGLLLRPATADEAPPASRLGGPPLLPPGQPWPITATGTPLSFLAALDLAELRAGRLHDAMPGGGWLLFYASIDDVEYAEPNRDGSPIRVFHVEDGPVPADPPGGLDAILGHHPVGHRLILTLPDGYDAADDLGLDDFEGETFEEISEQLQWAMDPADRDAQRRAGYQLAGDAGPAGVFAEAPDDEDDDAPALAAHWVGGLGTGVQGHPPEPGTVLLLHLSDDDALGFTWGDGGAFQFRIPADALARRDWTEVLVYADSC